jgi:hypothetical protein
VNRVIFKDDLTLIDISEEVEDFYGSATSVVVTASQDAIYIGSRHPFNHLYFKLGTVNTNPSIMSLKYWADGWESVVDRKDGTAGFTRSGYVSFTPNKAERWERESTNYQGEAVTDLEGIVIYDMYWLKITFSADFSAGTSLSWIGNKFSDDSDLGAEFPDLVRSNVKAAFKAGKTDWEEQHLVAARTIIADLEDRGYIRGSGNIIQRSDLVGAAVQKCAEIIYRSFGDDYIDRAAECRAEYNRRLDKRFSTYDKNENALEDTWETTQPSGWLSR